MRKQTIAQKAIQINQILLTVTALHLTNAVETELGLRLAVIYLKPRLMMS